MIWNLTALVCFIPALLSSFYYKRIDFKVYPFVYSVWFTFFIESIAFVGDILQLNFVKPICYNFFIIINLALWLHFFVLNSVFKKNEALYTFSFITAVNIMELMQLGHNSFITISSMLESIVIIWGCIKIISETLFFSKTSLLSNFFFLISFTTITLSLFDIFNSLVSYVVDLTIPLRLKISYIFKVINASYYLALTYAFYCLLWKKK